LRQEFVHMVWVARIYTVVEVKLRDRHGVLIEG
jgi:hypothetical protein